MAQWNLLSARERAELIAHEMVKNMRDHYYFDVRSGKKEKPKSESPWDAMRRRFFGGTIHAKDAKDAKE